MYSILNVWSGCDEIALFSVQFYFCTSTVCPRASLRIRRAFRTDQSRLWFLKLHDLLPTDTFLNVVSTSIKCYDVKMTLFQRWNAVMYREVIFWNCLILISVHCMLRIESSVVVKGLFVRSAFLDFVILTLSIVYRQNDDVCPKLFSSENVFNETNSFFRLRMLCSSRWNIFKKNSQSTIGETIHRHSNDIQITSKLHPSQRNDEHCYW